MNEREEWLLSMYDHIRNVEGSKRPPGFPPNESEYMEAVELDRARRQAAERMKYGTIEQGPTGFMADYIRPMIDSMEQPRMGGPDGVSTVDLMNLGMLGAGVGGSAIRPRPSSGVPTPPRPTIDQMQRTGKKQFEAERRSEVPTPPKPTYDELRNYLRSTEKANRDPKATTQPGALQGRGRGGVGPAREMRDGRGDLDIYKRPHPGMNVERRADLQEYMERMMAGMGKYFPPGK